VLVLVLPYSVEVNILNVFQNKIVFNFISSVSFNALHYIMSYILFPLSDFQYVPSFCDPSVMCSKERKTDLLHCPVCLFQTGQADGPFSRSCLPVPSVRDWPFSLSRLSRYVLVRPDGMRQEVYSKGKTVVVVEDA